MAKLLLLSVLIMTIAIPMRNARAKSPRAGLQRTIRAMAIYILCWFVFLIYVFAKIA